MEHDTYDLEEVDVGDDDDGYLSPVGDPKIPLSPPRSTHQFSPAFPAPPNHYPSRRWFYPLVVLLVIGVLWHLLRSRFVELIASPSKPKPSSVLAGYQPWYATQSDTPPSDILARRNQPNYWQVETFDGGTALTPLTALVSPAHSLSSPEVVIRPKADDLPLRYLADAQFTVRLVNYVTTDVRLLEPLERLPGYYTFGLPSHLKVTHDGPWFISASLDFGYLPELGTLCDQVPCPRESVTGNTDIERSGVDIPNRVRLALTSTSPPPE